ncbi:MAG: succinyl-diaminopimelate desuccinylase [Propionibacteriaceae bacterium]|jgi:succinyl-diaminopimelate desuccinylase|nr:succinyl-diaminopimelate desuccinylase [Propionibacteriaceae bacterium]
MLNVHDGLVTLFRQIVDIESVSGNEAPLADQVEATLREFSGLHIERHGDTVVARTELGKPGRVVIAGHLDTVPVKGNLPSTQTQGRVYGRGTADMKGGVAVMLAAALKLEQPRHDVTWIWYDHEEVESSLNSLGHIDPELLKGDLAILMEPTCARIEGGCQGTLRFEIKTRGKTAHSARAWMGHDAIHDMAEPLARLQGYVPREVEVEGLTYKEGLNAVGIRGGIATNVIPDECVLTVNFRFAPDRDEASAKGFCEQFFAGYELEYTDFAPAARPGLDRPIVAEFSKAVGGEPRPKYGWTDVARFSALGVPALNFGPGDPLKAHADDEYCDIADLDTCFNALVGYLG